MKCCNPECIMEATLMPRVKHGPIKQYTDAACQHLGVAAKDAAADEGVREQVMHEARCLAWSEHPDLGCCDDCTGHASKLVREVHELGEDDEATIQFVPMPPKRRAT